MRASLRHLLTLAVPVPVVLAADRFRRRRALVTVVRAYFRAWENGDVAGLRRLVSDDYVGHVHALAGTEDRDGDGLAAALAAHAETFTSSSFDVDDVISDHGRVAARVHLRATHGDDGRDVETLGLVHLRIAKGRIAEEWASWDYLGLARQLGVEVNVES